MAGTLLEVNGLRKSFGGLVAVDNVSFKVNEGDIFGIIGPNGAGKTTVFNLLTGFVAASSGRAVFCGKGVLGLKPPQVVSAGIARTFQNIRLFGQMSVLDNVRVGMHCRAKSNFLDSLLRLRRECREEDSVVEESLDLLARFELHTRWNLPAGALPYGDQRLLEIARALASRPRLLLLDEPAAGMNPEETERLMDQIRLLRDWNITIALIEHDMRVVMGVCERIIVLDYGRVIAEGAPDEIKGDPRVVEAYLGKGAGADA